MANLSAIKLPNGTTYNLVDKTSGYTKNTGTITSITTTAGAHTAVNITSGAVSFNVPTTAAHVDAVPTTRKVNNRVLSSDITLTPSDIGAVADVKLNGTSIKSGPVADLVTSELVDIFYPVGSYYETSDTSFDPNETWGGTWTLESTAKQPTGEHLSYINRNSVNVTTNTARTVYSQTYTSKTGRVYVLATCPYYTSRYTAVMTLVVDGVQQEGYSTTNSTTLQRGVIALAVDVGAGSHTFEVKLAPQDSGTTATLPAYQTFTLFVMDIANPNGGMYRWHRTA